MLGRVEGKSKFDGCDRLTGKLLENLALSSDPDTKRCYASHLTQLVTLQGVRFVRWQTRFFDAASAALAIEDLETRLAILEATEKVLEVCGEQVRPHARSALEMLLRKVNNLWNFDCSTGLGNSQNSFYKTPFIAHKLPI